MSTVSAQDATMYWLSGRTRNDLFLLYCFADSTQPTAELRAWVAQRSSRIADLRVRLREIPRDLGYPSWVPAEFSDEQFIEYFPSAANWPAVCAGVGKLLGTGVDAAVRPWRLHVFRGVAGVPAPGQPADAGPAMVVVLQMSHALADGRRAAEIARALFTESDQAAAGILPLSDARDSCRDMRGRIGSAVARLAPVDPIFIDSAWALLLMPSRFVRTMVLGYQAFRAQQELAELTRAGLLPPPAPEFTPTSLNLPRGQRGVVDGVEVSGSPDLLDRRHLASRTESGAADSPEATGHAVRMMVCEVPEVRVPGRTVTVVVLTAVSIALARYLAERGEQVERLGAQVPMALSTNLVGAHNNYRSLGVDLFADEPDPRMRAEKIAVALTARRQRAQHPLLAAQDRATAAVPAVLLRRDIERYPLDLVPDSIAGHTVVSSVHRGPADLTFGGGRVRFTAGFPAIGSVMRLTHGVQGLGDTVTISIHADAEVLPDIDHYTELLRSALREVVAGLDDRP